MSQKKRRVRKISAIRTPAAGRSANRLRYWLCTRLQTLPHIGHRQTLAATLIPITKHRTHSNEFKRQVAAEFLAGETLHGLAKRHDICRNLIRVWV